MKIFNWLSPLKLNFALFRLAGIWPTGEKYTYEFYTFYSMVAVGFLLSGHMVLNVVQIWIVGTDDLTILIPTIFIALTQTLAVLKSCIFIKNVTRVKRLMTILESDMFQPKSLEQKKKFEPDLNSWKSARRSFLVIVFATLVMFLFAPILSGKSKKHKLPFPAWFPYDVQKPLNYELTYLYQTVVYVCRMAVTVGVDTFVAGLNTYIGAQCTILVDTLRNLKFTKNFDTDLKKCIIHHQNILRFAENINTFFNYIVLSQFFSSLMAIALSMFMLSLVDPFSSEGHAILLYCGLVISEIFLYCWYGNEVDVKSSQIPYAAFESDWTGIPIEAKKNLLIFIMRAQKPIKMSAINLFSLSLATFTTILRTSWSYFAVLRQVNAQE